MMDALMQGLAWLPETVVTMLQDHACMYFSLPSSCWWCKHDARLLTTNNSVQQLKMLSHDGGRERLQLIVGASRSGSLGLWGWEA